MGGILSDSERNRIIEKIRWLAQKLCESGKPKYREALLEAWKELPELRLDPLPPAKEVLRMLREMDLRNAELERLRIS